MLGLVFVRMRREVSLHGEKGKPLFMCSWAIRIVIVILQKLNILKFFIGEACV